MQQSTSVVVYLGTKSSSTVLLDKVKYSLTHTHTRMHTHVSITDSFITHNLTKELY